MQYKEFTQYIKELQKYYNQELNETELKIWFNSLRFMTIERFNLIISEIYKTNKYMPKLSEILDIHKQLPYTTNREQKQIEGHCKKCNDTGYVMYTKIIDGMPYQYAAVCDCGREQRYTGKDCVDERNRSEYCVPTIQEIGLEVKDSMPSDAEIVKSMNKLANSNIISDDIRNLIRQEFRKRRVK